MSDRPIPTTPGIYVRKDAWAISVPAEVIESDISVDALAAYSIVMLWLDRDENVTASRLADRMACTPDRAREVIDELMALSGLHWAEESAPSVPESPAPVQILTPVRVPAMAELDPEPNQPGGSWSGSWPLEAGDAFPPLDTNVVYVLFDSECHPVYVGSTGQFRARIQAHACEKREQWISWTAYPCSTRGEAYDVERRFLQQYKPVLNRKGAGRSAIVGGAA